MAPLANDITRCHDGDCLSRKRCLRWVERETGSSHMVSLREPTGGCSHYIHPGPAPSPIAVPDWIPAEHAATYRRAWVEGWIQGWQDAQPAGSDGEADED